MKAIQFCTPLFIDLLELKYFILHLPVRQQQQSPKYCVETNVSSDAITFTDKLFGFVSIGQRRFEENVLCQKPAEILQCRGPHHPRHFIFRLSTVGHRICLWCIYRNICIPQSLKFKNIDIYIQHAGKEENVAMKRRIVSVVLVVYKRGSHRPCSQGSTASLGLYFAPRLSSNCLRVVSLSRKFYRRYQNYFLLIKNFNVIVINTPVMYSFGCKYQYNLSTHEYSSIGGKIFCGFRSWNE